MTSKTWDKFTKYGCGFKIEAERDYKPKAEPCILINRLSEMEKSLMTASVEKFEQPRKWKISSQSKHFLFGFALGALSLFAVLVWLVSFYN